jgi:hypothetical protein
VRGTRVVRGDGEMNHNDDGISDQACGIRSGVSTRPLQLRKDTES